MDETKSSKAGASKIYEHRILEIIERILYSLRRGLLEWTRQSQARQENSSVCNFPGLAHL